MKPGKHFIITFLAVWLGGVAAAATCYSIWRLVESQALDWPVFGPGPIVVMFVIIVPIGVFLATRDKSPPKAGSDAATDSSDPSVAK